VSPNIRGGFRDDIAGGDYLESKSVGLFGGIGVEFMRTKRVSFGIEVSDDDSKIVVKGNGPYHDIPAKQDKEVAPCGFMASIYVIF
jgi:hypothetical protein